MKLFGVFFWLMYVLWRSFIKHTFSLERNETFSPRGVIGCFWNLEVFSAKAWIERFMKIWNINCLCCEVLILSIIFFACSKEMKALRLWEENWILELNGLLFQLGMNAWIAWLDFWILVFGFVLADLNLIFCSFPMEMKGFNKGLVLEHNSMLLPLQMYELNGFRLLVCLWCEAIWNSEIAKKWSWHQEKSTSLPFMQQVCLHRKDLPGEFLSTTLKLLPS